VVIDEWIELSVEHMDFLKAIANIITLSDEKKRYSSGSSSRSGAGKAKSFYSKAIQKNTCAVSRLGFAEFMSLIIKELITASILFFPASGLRVSHHLYIKSKAINT
jgi:hypothetical protein